MSSNGVPALHVQLCKHMQTMWSYQNILYNQGCPEFRGSNHRENEPEQRRLSQTNHNESYLFVTPDNSPQQTVDLVESTAFFQANLVHNMKGQICVAWQLLIESKWWEWDVFVYIHATKLKQNQ